MAAVLQVAASRQVAKQVATEVILRILAPSVGVDREPAVFRAQTTAMEFIAFWDESADCVSAVLIPGRHASHRSGKAFCPHLVCRQGSDLLDCSVGGLRAGPEATGVQLHGEGISALPN